MECCYEECQSQKVQVSINKNSFYFICILFWKSYEKEQITMQEVPGSSLLLYSSPVWKESYVTCTSFVKES